MKFIATLLTFEENDNKKNENELLSNTNAHTFMLGRFAKISALNHKNLCKYFEFSKCQTVSNAYILISEHYSQTYGMHDSFLNNKIGSPDLNLIYSVALQVCTAIEFCHKNKYTIASLSLDHLLVDSTDKLINVKLADYGISYITGEHYDKVRKAINSFEYQPPEYLLNILPKGEHTNYFWIDIWSFGIILIELFTGWRIAEIINHRQFMAIITTTYSKSENNSIYEPLINSLVELCPAFRKRINILNSIQKLIEQCLNIYPSKRPKASEVLGILKQASIMNLNVKNNNFNNDVIENSELDQTTEEIQYKIKKENELNMLGFYSQSLHEFFFLWKLCGSNVENILERSGTIKTLPPIITLPSLLTHVHIFENDKSGTHYLPFSVVELPINNLMERLKHITYEKIFKSFELKKYLEINNDFCISFDNEEWASAQLLMVKERNIEYQFHRMHLFRRLLSAWPNKMNILREESEIDIPPIYRGPVWAALLGVLPFPEDMRAQIFHQFDTQAEHISDRQLQVDIPRCHQYDELMSSPMAHYQMRILLKALLVSRKDEFVYWQGLDSLSAPFLILHFNDLPTAFRCLNSFIDRYLRGFFLKDNVTVIRNYLAEFMRIIEFADPELFTHLISLDFHPELFAIPWFLTCFAHVLPLQKLFYLWDALLLSDAEFPLFIGVAILLQFRSKLITANFNEAILMFSDLPDLKIDNVVSTAKFYHNKWRLVENVENTQIH